jgi:hypothetical protein
MSRRGSNRSRYRRQELREQAIIFAEARATRSPKQQLALLDLRLGVGMGAAKERAALAALIEDRRKNKNKKGKVQNGKKTKQRGAAKNTSRKN